MNIMVNARVLGAPLTGVQRYLGEILPYLPDDVGAVAPGRVSSGIRGHLWEQICLPKIAGSALLWSPSNTGPVWMRQQVVTVHDVLALDHPEWLHWKFAAWYRFLLPRLVRRVRHVIAVSAFTRARLLASTQVRPDKVTVIPNGVDAKFHPRPDAEIAVAVAALALPSRRYLLTVGSLEPRKNLARLMQAWGEIHSRVDEDIWLVVAGGKGQERVFGGYTGVEILPPRVHLTGHVADAVMPALYAGALGFVYVSEYEGFGLPPLEAMASGVPVLVSNSTVFPEIVADCGIYTDPLDIDSIAQGLRRLVDGEGGEDFAARGLLRAREFTWAKTAERTLHVLRQAAS